MMIKSDYVGVKSTFDSYQISERVNRRLDPHTVAYRERDNHGGRVFQQAERAGSDQGNYLKC
jgi:hypothetical protein